MAKVRIIIYMIMSDLYLFMIMLMTMICLVIIELLSMLNKGVKRTLECLAYKHVYKIKVIECIYVTICWILCIFYVN